MDKSLEIDVSFRDEALEEVISILEEVGAQNIKEVKQRGFTGVEIAVVGALVSSALANLVIRLLPLWKCGVIVDARGSRVLTEKNCDLPRGTVLVISPDGTESKVHEPSELQMKSLLKELVSRLK